MRCEEQCLGSASERRQRDRTVGFEGKWAYMPIQGKTLHSSTKMRIQHELTERSSNLRHGLLGGLILACSSLIASRSECQIIASAAPKVLNWHDFFRFTTGDVGRKVKRIRRTLRHPAGETGHTLYWVSHSEGSGETKSFHSAFCLLSLLRSSSDAYLS